MEEEEIDFKTLFPNLIIFISPNKSERLFKQLKKSFNEFKYGPIYIEEGKRELGGRTLSTCRILQHSVYTTSCLAVGEGTLPCDAEEQAVGKLMKKLRESCYVIEANPEYCTKKKLPSFALHADPALSNIYKVVYLKKNSLGVKFPHPVSGAVCYVEDYKSLFEYIETHASLNSRVDLFILNVLKSDRQRIREVCEKCDLMAKNLVGCSDMGLFVFRFASTRVILQDLLAAGGNTVKYKLIGPQDKCGIGDAKVKKEETAVESEDISRKEEEVVVNPWIADRLIVMEVVNEWSELESSREIIWCSVRDCPDTQEFIIEKKINQMGMINAEALIDRNVVGRSRGFCEKEVKAAAAEDAMRNLRKCCYYIEAKKSYFGSSVDVPEFLKQSNPVSIARVYRIAERTAEWNNILKQFRSAPQEDLFFLHLLTRVQRDNIVKLAKSKHFLVRTMGRKNLVCVYKKRKPREIFMELMATSSKENEKYKLIIPPAKINHPFGRTSTQEHWNNDRVPDGTQYNTHRVCRDQEIDIQPWNQQNNIQDPYEPRDDHSGVSQSYRQEPLSSKQENNETPNWVLSFIESASEKKPPKVKGPKENSRKKDDVYHRYKFKAPKTNPSFAAYSKINFQGSVRRPDQNLKRDSKNIQNEFTRGVSNNSHVDNEPSLSERVQKILSEKYQQVGNQNQINLEKNIEIPSISGFAKQYSTFDKNEPPSNWRERVFKSMDQELSSSVEGGPVNEYFRPSDTLRRTTQGAELTSDYSKFFDYSSTGSVSNHIPNESNTHSTQRSVSTNDFNIDRGNKRPGQQFNEESESNKLSRFTTNPHSSGHNGSYGRLHLKEEERGYEDYSENNSSIMFDNPGNSYHRRNLYHERSNVKKVEELPEDVSRFSDRMPDSTQGIGYPWERNVRQPHDQRFNSSSGRLRNYTNLFDGVIPQDPATPPFLMRPPNKRKKNQQFKNRGSSFSKIEKYGKKWPK